MAGWWQLPTVFLGVPSSLPSMLSDSQEKAFPRALKVAGELCLVGRSSRSTSRDPPHHLLSPQPVLHPV